MERMRRKGIALFMSLVMILAAMPRLLPAAGVLAESLAGIEDSDGTIGTSMVKSSSNDTYTSYVYGTKGTSDYGVVCVPNKAGTYQGGVLVHANQTWSITEDQVMTVLNDWVSRGLIRPMIIVCPFILQTETTGDHRGFVAEGRLASVVSRMENGTFNVGNRKIDCSKKFILSGWALGGAVALYGGSKLRDKFAYVGALSPSPYAYYPSSEQWKSQNWLLNDKDTKSLAFSTDADRYLYMSASMVEDYCQYRDVVNVAYTGFGKAKGFTRVLWDEGEHGWDLYKVELFYFLYNVQNKTAPSDSVIKKAFGKNLTRYVTLPDDKIKKDPITGTVSLGSESNMVFGKTLRARVSGSNAEGTVSSKYKSKCNPYAYKWYRDDTLISDERTMYYELKAADVGHTIKCVVTNSTGIYSGSISVVSSVIKKATGVKAPTGLSVVPCTKGKADGQITNVTKAMEYATKSDFSDAKACTGTVITGLSKGTYYVRFKATNTHEASAAKAMKISEEDLSSEPLTGKVSISGERRYKCTLTAKVTDSNATNFKYQWLRDGKVIATAVSKTYTVQASDVGTKLTCVVTDRSGKYAGSVSWTTVKIQKGYGPDAPTGLVAVNCSKAGASDGKIKNVSTKMEYATCSDFSDAKSCTSSTITGLKKGIYYVRLKETARNYAGAMVSIEIK